MRVIFYYRCADPRIIEAKAMDNTKALAIEAAAVAFAKEFNAVPVFSQGFDPRMVGITFDKARPPANWKLWTQPERGNPCMLPRSPEAVEKKLKPLAKHTQDKFRSLWPTGAASPYESCLLSALGITSAATQGNALQFFYDEDKVSWIATTLPLDGTSLPTVTGELGIRPRLEGFCEVVASEFDVARATWQFKQAQAEAAAAAPAANEGDTK